jgi:hypothetical protein
MMLTGHTSSVSELVHISFELQKILEIKEPTFIAEDIGIYYVSFQFDDGGNLEVSLSLKKKSLNKYYHLEQKLT